MVRLRNPSRSSPADGAPELLDLLADNVRTEVPIRPRPVSLLAELFREVEDQSHRQTVVPPRELEEGLSSLALHVGGVHDGELLLLAPLRRDEVEDFVGFRGGSLIVLVVRHEPAAEVG
jgi:hypothetical protein